MSKIKESNTKVRKRSRFTRGAYIIGVVLVVCLIVDLVGVGGNIRFYAKWIECGQKPVEIQGSGFFNSGVSHYLETASTPRLLRNPNQFCSAFEAEQYGYSSNPNYYDFPELKNRYGKWCRHVDDPQPETAAVFDLCDQK